MVLRGWVTVTDSRHPPVGVGRVRSKYHSDTSSDQHGPPGQVWGDRHHDTYPVVRDSPVALMTKHNLTCYISISQIELKPETIQFVGLPLHCTFR